MHVLQGMGNEPVNKYRYAAIDVGTANFALRVEERRSGRIFSLVNETVSFGKKKRQNIYASIMQNVQSYIESHLDVLNSCNAILVEQQISTDMARVESYITGILSKSASGSIILVNAKSKEKLLTQHYDISQYKDKRTGLKKGSLHVAELITQLSGDDKGYQVLRKTKSDHLADAIVMIEQYIQSRR